MKISSVTLEDDATFQCQVGALDNVPGIRSQNARLTVRVRPDDPVIVLGNLVPYHHHLNNNNLQQQEVQLLSTTAGNKIELTCESHGGRPAAEVCFKTCTIFSIISFKSMIIDFTILNKSLIRLPVFFILVTKDEPK